MLELTYNWDTEEYTGRRNFGHLTYRVDNIDDTCQKPIEEGVIISQAPRGGYTFIKLPNSILIE